MRTPDSIKYKVIKPEPALSDFVEGVWMLENTADTAHDIVVLPNGRFDIIFLILPNGPYHAAQMGLETEPSQASIPAKAILFAISFKLLAIEYLLDKKAASIVNTAVVLPNDFWGITTANLNSLENFYEKVSVKMISLIKPGIDSRKQKLFDLIYSSKGVLSVRELSEKVFWSSRQINRYFNEFFGISLKSYCNILRFEESLPYITAGKLFPELNFTDQNHFIKEVKKYSGVIPKELFRNKNDRFLLFHPMPKK
ncbi:helix-turn-helix domain-containing protein [Dyadobacter psychrotolerans]|uniref:AraC family transcriptional regulator n=1 Tax=Dyadobacter psychrotolerans TaxID=2541721 RepID=A0A4R5DSB1_9BACT|nr:AraC family transcriptional regulator [Dyadobacter psychrotolerans]TDE15234.1 AraC family transcriptional regulator [Dyadobacter psychrotolerans]